MERFNKHKKISLKMKKAGICHICENNIAKYSCISCGKLVCEDCFDKIKNICINCKIGKR